MQAGSNHFDGCLMPFLEKGRQRCSGFRIKVSWRRVVNFFPSHHLQGGQWGEAKFTRQNIFSDRLRYLPCIRWDGALININARIWRRMSAHYWRVSHRGNLLSDEKEDEEAGLLSSVRSDWLTRYILTQSGALGQNILSGRASRDPSWCNWKTLPQTWNENRWKHHLM